MVRIVFKVEAEVAATGLSIKTLLWRKQPELRLVIYLCAVPRLRL
jgi:hypothetical protein